MKYQMCIIFENNKMDGVAWSVFASICVDYDRKYYKNG